MTYSCNGFHDEEHERTYGGISNLWKDAMSRHTQQPYHLQVLTATIVWCQLQLMVGLSETCLKWSL
jgi:hypothetical protein